MTIETVNAYKCHCGAAYLTFESALSCAPCDGCGEELPIVNARHLRARCDGCRRDHLRKVSREMAEAREAKDLAVPFVEVEVCEGNQQWMVDDQFVTDLDNWMYDAPQETDFSKTLAYNTKREKLGAPYEIVQAEEVVRESWTTEFEDGDCDGPGGERFDAALKALIEAINEQGPTIYYAITTGRIDMATYAKDYYLRNPA